MGSESNRSIQLIINALRKSSKIFSGKSKQKKYEPAFTIQTLSYYEMISKCSGRKENWYIRLITYCMSSFNILGENDE